MSSFKLSKRLVHSDDRSTLLDKHDNKLKMLQEKDKKISDYKAKLKNTKDELKKNELIKKIEILESDEKLNDYLFNLVDFLNQEEINSKKSEDNFSNNNDGIYKFISIDSRVNSGKIYDNYMEKCHGIKKYKKNTKIFNCSNCNSKLINSSSEGLAICYFCGNTEIINVISTIEWNSYENYEFVKPFSYKRSNHFKEWINQIQGREGTNIPDNIIDSIFLEIRKERIVDKKEVTYDKIKEYLKKLKFNKYYEHIPNILHRITGNRQLIISQNLEKTLNKMFNDIQIPFEKNCPKSRKNFLSYSYTLYKFFQILKMEDFLIYFPLLKSREKLFEQELIWKKICNDLDWEFIKCI